MRIMAFSSSNRNSARARASSVLPTPVGPRKMNEPIGRLRILQAGAGPNDRVGDGLHRFVLADDALVQLLAQVQQLLHFAFEQLFDGNAASSG